MTTKTKTKKTELDSLQDILTEIKGLRKDLKQTTKRQLNSTNADEIKPFLEQYQKILGGVVPKIFPNLVGSSSVSCGSGSGSGSSGSSEKPMASIMVNLDELKTNLADYVKEMTKAEVLEHMPDNLKGAYMRLIQSIIKPNDPIFDERKADPREPSTNK